ncbi:MAG: hypothetical protein K2K60_03900, partial [Clostridia bacterium]|nr:hypothetical protein [Clostridia bacterium]
MSVFYVHEHLYTVFINFAIVGHFTVQDLLNFFKTFFFSDCDVASFVNSFGGKQLYKAVANQLFALIDSKGCL